jgi:FdhD protein
VSERSDIFRITRHEPGQAPRDVDDHVAVEEPLEIRVGGRPISVTMRTPGDDEALAAGFLLSEGLIRAKADLERIAHCDVEASCEGGSTINAVVAAHVAVDLARLTRHVFASSSCGICGSATIDAIRKGFPPIESELVVPAALVQSLVERLRGAQPTFDATGGLHAAALFNDSGAIVHSAEDVGRHNAVDKVIGRTLLNDSIPANRSILMVSGRASFEIVQKALSAGIPIVVAISASSTLAIDLAREVGITLVGFLRPHGFNVYAGEQRVRG